MLDHVTFLLRTFQRPPFIDLLLEFRLHYDLEGSAPYSLSNLLTLPFSPATAFLGPQVPLCRWRSIIVFIPGSSASCLSLLIFVLFMAASTEPSIQLMFNNLC